MPHHAVEHDNTEPALASKEATPVEIHQYSDDYENGTIEVKDIAGTNDMGAHMFTEAANYDSPETEHEKNIVKRRLDRTMLPILMFSFTLQFLDKLSLNYGSAYTLVQDLNLVGTQYSTVASAYSYGIVIWAVPANYLIQKYPVSKYTGFMIFIWGALILSAAATKNFGGIFAVRLILGMAEANMTPAYMLITSMFYKREEQPFRFFLYVAMNGVATMLGSLFAFGLGHVNHTMLASWQLMFLIIGALNVVWAAVFLLLVPDTPMQTSWLTPKERVLAVSRTSENMIGVRGTKLKAYQVKEALMDPKTWIMAVAGAALGVMSGGLGNFLSALTKGFGFTGLNATLLQLPTGAIEVIVLPIAGWVASRYPDVRCVTYAGFSLIALGGFMGTRFTPHKNRWQLVGSSWLFYTSAIGSVACYNLLATNFAGHTKRSTVNAIWFMVWNASSIAGTYLFFPHEAPRHLSAITSLIVCQSAFIVSVLVLRQYMSWENKKRDKEMAALGLSRKAVFEEAIRLRFLDKADIENQYFRYGL